MSRLTRDTVMAGLQAARLIQQGHLPTEADLTAAPVLSRTGCLRKSRKTSSALPAWSAGIRCLPMAGAQPA